MFASGPLLSRSLFVLARLEFVSLNAFVRNWLDQGEKAAKGKIKQVLRSKGSIQMASKYSKVKGKHHMMLRTKTCVLGCCARAWGERREGGGRQRRERESQGSVWEHRERESARSVGV